MGTADAFGYHGFGRVNRYEYIFRCQLYSDDELLVNVNGNRTSKRINIVYLKVCYCLKHGLKKKLFVPLVCPKIGLCNVVGINIYKYVYMCSNRIQCAAQSNIVRSLYVGRAFQ